MRQLDIAGPQTALSPAAILPIALKAEKNQGKSGTIASTVAVGLREYFIHRGLNSERILRASRLLEDASGSNYSRFPTEKLAVACELAAHETGDSFFGLHFGEWYEPTHLYPCNFAISHAPDLHAALFSLCEHRNQVADIPTTLILDEDGALVTWNINCGKMPSRHVNEFKFTRTLKQMQRTFGADCVPELVMLKTGKPTNTAEYQRLLGETLLFDQSTYGFRVPGDLLNKSNPKANPDIYHMAHETFRALPAKRPCSQNPVDRVRKFVSKRLEENGGSLAAAAAHMGVTPYQLRRQLKERKTCFQCVVDETRRSLARHYVLDTNLPFSEIAIMLGFSDQSVLTRAIKRWFGVTPKDLRSNRRTAA